MLELNLPTCQLKFADEGGRVTVWDQVRMKYVAFTPEENVRQHFVSYLISAKGYPATHLMNEVSLNLNGLSRRCDTVAYDRQLTPKVIVEYKSSLSYCLRKSELCIIGNYLILYNVIGKLRE